MRKAYLCFLKIALIALAVGVVMVGISVSLGSMEVVRISDEIKPEYENVDLTFDAGKVKRLELAFKWGEVDIKEGDVLSFSAVNATKGAFSGVEVTPDGTLRICENDVNDTISIGPFIKIPVDWISYGGNHTEYTLTIPEGMKFEEVVISTGAGEIDVCSFEADAVEMNFGAGEVKLDDIVCRELYFEAGAGAINAENIKVLEKSSVKSGAGEFVVGGTFEVANAEFDHSAGEVEVNRLVGESVSIKSGMGEFNVNDIDTSSLNVSLGAGEVNVSGVVEGKTDIDVGAGEVNLSLSGEDGDYSVNVDKGAGEVTVNGTSIGESYGNASAPYRIDVDLGAGEVNIDIE